MDARPLSRNPRCRLCPLHTTCKTVCMWGSYGQGNMSGVDRKSIDLMVIAEAPGREEDQKGECLVGKSGQKLFGEVTVTGPQPGLFEKVCNRLDMDWADITWYKTNVMKCRPPGNRDPRHQTPRQPHEEILACRNYLFREIEVVNPRLILTMGRFAANVVIRGRMNKGQVVKLAEDRYGLHWAPLRWTETAERQRTRQGKKVMVTEYTTTVEGSPLYPVIVTYHPAAVMRQPRLKNYFYEDLEATFRLLKED